MEHGLFPKETLNVFSTPMPVGVGVEKAFAELFSKSDRTPFSKKRIFLRTGVIIVYFEHAGV